MPVCEVKLIPSTPGSVGLGMSGWGLELGGGWCFWMVGENQRQPGWCSLITLYNIIYLLYNILVLAGTSGSHCYMLSGLVRENGGKKPDVFTEWNNEVL